MKSLIKKPSAWLPIVLSIIMLAIMAGMFTMSGVPTPDQSKDEGVGAHLFQIWLVLEIVLVLLFAIRWLPREPKRALIILVIQILLVLATCFPVFYFKL